MGWTASNMHLLGHTLWVLFLSCFHTLLVSSLKLSLPLPTEVQRCTSADIAGIRGWILDCDGVLYNWGGLIPGTQEFFNWLHGFHFPYVLMSNTLKTRSGVTRKFGRLNIHQSIEPEKVVTVGEAMAEYMAEVVPPNSKILGFGTKATFEGSDVESIPQVLSHIVRAELFSTWDIRESLNDEETYEWANIASSKEDRKVYVVVAFGDEYPTADYIALAHMSILLRNGGYLIVAGPDLVDTHPRNPDFPHLDNTWPSLGGYEQFLIASAEMFPGSDSALRHVNVGKGGNLGKQYMIDKGIEILKRSDPDITNDNVMVVGDNLGTDILGANLSGMKSILVLSGAHQIQSIPVWPAKPSCYLESVEQIPKLMSGQQNQVAI